MQKIKLILPILVMMLVGAACGSAQTTQEADLPTPSLESESSPTSPPTNTVPPPPTPATTQTSLPSSAAAAGQYPWISSSSDLFNRVISLDPIDPQRIAYCAPGEIRVSLDAGQTWEHAVTTTGVSAAAEAQGYTLFAGEPVSEDACLSVTLDPNHSAAYYAVFTAALEEFGAPPLFYMGFYTPDSGSSWYLVPPPPPATLENFGGFWNLTGDKVQAQFLTPGQPEGPTQNIFITETVNGAVDWQPGELSCPAVDPCLRWGPAPSNIPGMGSPLPQNILISSDDGSTWSVIDPPVELRAPAPNQLVAFSDREFAILSGAIALSSSPSDTPVIRYSVDAGASWQPVNLPPLSTQEPDLNYYPGLQYLPNNSYLTQAPESDTWYWWSPSFPTWCPVSSEGLPSYPVLLQTVGDQIWWVDPNTGQAENLLISEITCVES